MTLKTLLYLVAVVSPTAVVVNHESTTRAISPSPAATFEVVNHAIVDAVTSVSSPARVQLLPGTCGDCFDQVWELCAIAYGMEDYCHHWEYADEGEWSRGLDSHYPAMQEGKQVGSEFCADNHGECVPQQQLIDLVETSLASGSYKNLATGLKSSPAGYYLDKMNARLHILGSCGPMFGLTVAIYDLPFAAVAAVSQIESKKNGLLSET
jgi:hypothetical protein